MKFNDRLNRIQVGRDIEVPIENNSNLWVLWTYSNNEWDSDTISNWKSFIEELKKEEVKLIFCVWHGNHRTNLFLMDKDKLINRLIKIGK